MPIGIPQAPEILHTSHGLRIKRNAKNGFVVATLHYTADPSKRSPEWEKEARAGLNPAKFEQEYNINYTALFGEKVFPEIVNRRHEIVVKNPFMDEQIPKDLACWAGFDFGMVNPSSFHVYTIYDGIIYAIWELYEPCKNLIEYSAKLKNCPYWGQIRYIACDPSMFGLRHHNTTTGEGASIAFEFQQCGIHKLLEGNNNEESFIAAIRKHWNKEMPTFQIFENCPKLIWEFENILFRNATDRQLQTANYYESMVDKNNHALDDCKYFINSNVIPTKRKLRIPSMLEGYTRQDPARQRISERSKDLVQYYIGHV